MAKEAYTYINIKYKTKFGKAANSHLYENTRTLTSVAQLAGTFSSVNVHAPGDVPLRLNKPYEILIVFPL